MKVWRHFTIVGFFMLACGGLTARVVFLSVTEREFLQGQGDARSIRREVIPAYRGLVLDRYGEPLAVSTPVVAVWTDPLAGRLTTRAATRLAPLLELEVGEVLTDLEKNRKKEFMYLRRGVSWETAQRIKALNLEGVEFLSEYRRYYPAGETAAHVVGVTGVDDEGLEGIELSFDALLKGIAGEKRVLRDRDGHNIKDLAHRSAPRYGGDLTLSLDLRLQFLAYRELKAAVESHKARSGSLVMLDAHTGEILVLVNQPSYNPNERSRRGAVSMRNRAVTDTYEPGSTIKPFTVLAALESGRFDRHSLLHTDPGYFWIGRKLVQDPGNRGTITLETALKKSSQVGIAKVALALEDRSVYDMLARVGVGDYLGTGLPGEVGGTLTDAGLGSPLGRATLAFGYSLAVSPLQLAQAYLVLATGGIKLPVSIIRQERIPAGERVFDRKLAEEVVSMMEGVTDADGTAPKAAIPGYRVAGKTGTARKVGVGGYDDERHVAWFAGLAPASNPRVVAVVLVNEPKGQARAGGVVAAPIFGRVVARTLRLLGARPDEPLQIESGAMGS